MTTNNQYLDKYPISPESERLIVGTIHPHDHARFTLPFFYGNVTSLWSLLSDAFPDELKKPLTLAGVMAFLNQRKIAVSDTIRSCERKNKTALDQDLINLKLNTSLIGDIKWSKITEILFTSGFGKNNAFKLFYVDLLGQKITKEIKENREVTLDETFFGRPVRLRILYSPSGAANVGLSTSKAYLEHKHKYKNSTRPVYDFKVDYYRNIFGNLDLN